ncbi:MAG: Hsp20/alpha crystallin family protein, partial [Phycisphaerae bacterium]
MGEDPSKQSFRKLSNQMDAVIDEMMGRPYLRYCPTNAWQPDVNLYEKDGEFLVCIDLPGMRKEDFDISAQDNVLMIRGSRPRPLPTDGGDELRVHLMEINSGDFCREVEIPASVRHDDINAEYRDGLLWIRLPRS